MKKVAVIMGSDSDLPVLKGAFEQLKKLGIPFEAHVYSAHRTPAEAAAFAASRAGKRFRRADCGGGQGGAPRGGTRGADNAAGDWYSG